MQWRRELTWEPGRLGWRIAALFMVGSLLFAVGSFPAYAQLVAPGAVGITFFVGSVFFTSAGLSAFVEVVNGRSGPLPSRLWQPRQILWWSTAVQLFGTVMFNINTFDAMLRGLDREQTDKLVWAPDMLGSMAFLVASHLAWLAVCRRLWCVRRDDVDWWISAINYLGSIFFMFAAIASFTLDTTGDTANETVVNSGTFLGAVCFFVGAYLLLPAATDREPAPSAA